MDGKRWGRQLSSCLDWLYRSTWDISLHFRHKFSSLPPHDWTCWSYHVALPSCWSSSPIVMFWGPFAMHAATWQLTHRQLYIVHRLTTGIKHGAPTMNEQNHIKVLNHACAVDTGYIPVHSTSLWVYVMHMWKCFRITTIFYKSSWVALTLLYM